MTLIHRLAIGKLHNLVFVEEFLNILDFQLNHLNACIYCEHMFPSSTILKKHCRNSKHHFRIKPDNQKYDKYYISNYLLSPKEKKGVEDSDDYLGGCCSSVASAREEGQGDEDATWADWDEPLQEDEPVQCLFDDMICQNVDLLIQEHLKNVHQFDLYEYFERFQLEFYDRIKLVNYIRLESAKYKCFACGHQADDLETFLIHLAMDQGHLSHLPVEESWKNPQYLLPVNENDPLLRVLEICSDEDEN